MASDKQTRRIMLDIRSAKHDDVYKKICERDTVKYPKTIDFICDAIRYFNLESESLGVSEDKIKEIVDNMIKERFTNINLSNSTELDKDNSSEDTKKSLEDGIDKRIINIEDD